MGNLPSASNNSFNLPKRGKGRSKIKREVKSSGRVKSSRRVKSSTVSTKPNAGGVHSNVKTGRPHVEESKECVNTVLERKSRSRYISSFATMKNNNDLTIDNFFQRFEEMQKAMIESKELCLTNCRIPKNRVVFVSTLGLYQSWRYVPSCVLKDCILLLECKRDWVYNPLNYVYSNKSVISVIGATLDDEFLTMLKWKDSQNLAFWMNDSLRPWAVNFEKKINAMYDKYIRLKHQINEIENKNEKDMKIEEDDREITDLEKEKLNEELDQISKQLRIHHNRFDQNHRATAFWRYFSIELCKIYDPICKSNYSALLLDDRWWIKKYNYSLKNCTQYGCIPKQVIDEMHGDISPKFKSTMELVYQSNNSLLVVTNYRHLGCEIRGIRGLLTPMFENLNGDMLLCDPLKPCDCKNIEENCTSHYLSQLQQQLQQQQNNECSRTSASLSDNITEDSQSHSQSQSQNRQGRRHSVSHLTAKDIVSVMVDAEWAPASPNTNSSNLSTWISIDYDPYDVDDDVNSDDFDENNSGSDTNTNIDTDIDTDINISDDDNKSNTLNSVNSDESSINCINNTNGTNSINNANSV